MVLIYNTAVNNCYLIHTESSIGQGQVIFATVVSICQERRQLMFCGLLENIMMCGFLSSYYDLRVTLSDAGIMR